MVRCKASWLAAQPAPTASCRLCCSNLQLIFSQSSANFRPNCSQASSSPVAHVVLLPVSTTHGLTSRQIPIDSGYRTATPLWKQYLYAGAVWWLWQRYPGTKGEQYGSRDKT